MLRPLFAVLLALLAVACGDPSAAAGASGKPRVAVIPKGTTHVFWKAVEAGARVGAESTGLEVVWKGPLKEDDRNQQIQLVQQFVSEGVAGIALAPLDHVALAPVVASARQKGIPVVIFDSALDGTPGKDFDCFVATDNRKSGEMAGHYLVKLLGDAPADKVRKVVLLRYQAGSASTTEREAGFLDVVRAAGLEVTVDNRHAGASIGEAKSEALKLVDELRAADGVFCPNESVTAGMLLALEQLQLVGKLKFVGFDSSPQLVKGLKDGSIDGLILQDPRRMGDLSVQQLAARIAGKPVETVIDTGAALVTKANMHEPKIARLLE
ncbi:MAG: substrate-binding domain-containing protein [Planctomycetes bacterium]|nr:substrate-binding domain-containing protein [Planctomycetota bacterium]